MGWDRGVEFTYIYNKILRHMRKTKARRSKCYDAILLIQLRNGSRVSEAVRAFQHFIITGERNISVKLSKAKNKQRDMIIQDDIDDSVRELCIDLVDVDEKKLKKRMIIHALRTHKINTHSLRYAFITHLLSANVNIALISKIVGHSKLDTLLTYVQQKKAKELLEDLM